MSAYQRLESHFKKIGNLNHVQAITSWDESAMMPNGGGQARAEAMTTLKVLLHELTTSSEVGDLLAAAESESLDAWQSANLREIGRVYREATCMPADLVAAQKIATSASEQAWRHHRAANDWPAMLPHLKEVVSLSRQEATVRAEASGLGLYDALLDTYEPGVTSAEVSVIFDELKGFLPDFVEAILERQQVSPPLPVAGDFAIANQKLLGQEVMATLGFDFDHGRLDISHHPFCGGVPDDVRITTRYDEKNFMSALMGVIHETGHAMYEQGLPKDWRGQPVGRALSAGTHESQSLLMEMQACRTPEFFSYLAPRAQRIFLGQESNDPAWNAQNLFKLYTAVKRDFIRVDADEVTYPLHVILRFEIEQGLIDGSLPVEDLPDAWNEKMLTYLKVDTGGNFMDGCLQDVHWPAGLFGYFPTYTLGAMTATQLFASARQAIPDLPNQISRGDFAPLLAWLRLNVHGKGKFSSNSELMTAATGRPLEVAPFRSHLEARYLS
ncbi:MAG: carboxypeptidase Taq [Candidatus Azotimanducaceae bacterium]|jgi:carboxypeptidase Taq